MEPIAPPAADHHTVDPSGNGVPEASAPMSSNGATTVCPTKVTTNAGCTRLARPPV
jgi:hypothetical protein